MTDALDELARNTALTAKKISQPKKKKLTSATTQNNETKQATISIIQKLGKCFVIRSSADSQLVSFQQTAEYRVYPLIV